MGGIAGIIDLRGTREVQPQTLGNMLRLITHRGPAGKITKQQPGIAVGVRHSHMPASPQDEQLFVSADGSVWAVLDGCIFNRAELWPKL